jgi:TatD DNase family protein
MNIAGVWDSHIHFASYRDDYAYCYQRIDEGLASGIEGWISPVMDIEGIDFVSKVAQEKPVWLAVGKDPHTAYAFSDDERQRYIQALESEKTVAVGEIGLDYFHGKTWRNSQIEVLDEMIELANQRNLPVIIHCRDAFDDLFPRLRRAPVLQGGIFHCFTGSYEQAKQAADMGFYISFSGILTFKNSASLRETARKLPLQSVLVETDAPYLAPVPYRGKKNIPVFLHETINCLAGIRGLSANEIAELTRQNLFRLIPQLDRRE